METKKQHSQIKEILKKNKNVCVCVYIYLSIYICIYIHIYVDDKRSDSSPQMEGFASFLRKDKDIGIDARKQVVRIDSQEIKGLRQMLSIFHSRSHNQLLKERRER